MNNESTCIKSTPQRMFFTFAVHIFKLAGVNRHFYVSTVLL
jgi:hypothetical protein